MAKKEPLKDDVCVGGVGGRAEGGRGCGEGVVKRTTERRRQKDKVQAGAGQLIQTIHGHVTARKYRLCRGDDGNGVRRHSHVRRQLLHWLRIRKLIR